MKFQNLQKKYPKFIYEKFSYKISNNDLRIFFDFKIEPDIYFKPEITIKNVDKTRIKKIGDSGLNNLIFHLGLIEIPSYWKATCSPEIVIKAGPLNSEQIKWWKDLITKGMGQFFYENKINFLKPNFVKISANYENGSRSHNNCYGDGPRSNRILVPVGGGKDSIVTLEQLKKPTVHAQQRKKINCFLVNPTKAAKDVIRVAGIKRPIVVKRTIDPLLLELNKKGYLNGHTPFTALLSFLAVFCAVLFDYKNIAFSNEKSANEGNVKYLGKIINHQWSKSSEFERNFRYYCKKYLSQNINYFSYLRQYTELEISKMFTRYPQYFSFFSSCNACLAEARRRRVVQRSRPASAKSYGEARWCGNCPKCLFVYATLYPFLGKKELLKIFGKDLFENKKLLPVMKALIGQGKAKPFECIGTFKESRLAFKLSQKKAKRQGKIPYLLTKIK